MGRSDEIECERRRWRSVVRTRPERIAVPGPGQESVWDYPRPPRLERVTRRVRVEFGDVVLAGSDRALRVCETSSPPAYYLAPEDVRGDLLEPCEHSTLCEWKGVAKYWSVRVGNRVAREAAWSYPDPDPAYAALRHYFAFHAGRVDTCSVGDVRVSPQPGGFYGGWITPELVGPFKGEAGSEGW